MKFSLMKCRTYSSMHGIAVHNLQNPCLLPRNGSFLTQRIRPKITHECYSSTLNYEFYLVATNNGSSFTSCLGKKFLDHFKYHLFHLGLKNKIKKKANSMKPLSWTKLSNANISQRNFKMATISKQIWQCSEYFWQKASKSDTSTISSIAMSYDPNTCPNFIAMQTTSIKKQVPANACNHDQNTVVTAINSFISCDTESSLVRLTFQAANNLDRWSDLTIVLATPSLQHFNINGLILYSGKILQKSPEN